MTQGDGLRAQLLRGAMGSAGIQAANRLLALALAIMLARMLGPDGYGVYVYAFAIMGLLKVVAEAGVPTLLVREVAASFGRLEWGLLRGALRRAGQFVALVASAVSLVGLLVLWWLADSVRPEVLCTTALMLLVLPVWALCNTVAHAMRGLHQVVLGLAGDMLIRPLLVLLIVAVMFFVWPEQREPHVAMAAQLIGALVVLLIGLLVLRWFLPNESRHVPPEYRSRQWLKSALPFTLIGGAMIINTQADTIMLGWFMESDDVGLYRVASQGALLVAFPLQAAGAVLAPYFADLDARGDMKRLNSLYRTATKLVILLTLPLVAVFVLAGREILGFVFGDGYAGGSLALAILSIGYFGNISFGAVGTLLQMLGHEKVTAYLLGVASCLNILLNLLLIPMLGLAGAAAATAATVFFYHAALWVWYVQFVRPEV